MARLILYEHPKLVSQPDIGQILEALPGTLATQAGYDYGQDKDIVSTSDPTGIYGFVKGLNALERYGLPIGEHVVEQLFTGTAVDEYHGVDRHYIFKLSNWAKDDLVLVVGEIKPQTNDLMDEQGDEFLLDTRMPLTYSAINTIRRELIPYRLERMKKEFVFNAPDGKEYNVEEILLNIRKKE